MQWKNQPAGLYFLSFTEIADRFNYYGIQAILILYLTKTLLFDDKQAFIFYGIFTTLAFSIPLLGGYIADHFLGQRKAIICGLALTIIGNGLFLLWQSSVFFLSLALIIFGIGLFKGNNAALFGALYEKNDVRKEKGLTFFYLSMNVGGITGPLIMSFFAVQLNWYYGFLVNIVVVILALISFLIFLRRYDSNPIKSQNSFKGILFLFLGISAAIVCIYGFFHYQVLFGNLIWIIGGVAFLSLFVVAMRYQGTERSNLLLLIILYLFTICFFACFIQVGSSLTLFIDRCVQREVLGWEIPTAAFSAIQPIFMIVFVPLFSFFLRFFEHKPDLFMIFSRATIGIMLAGVSFAVFALAALSLNWSQHINFPLLGIILGNFLLGMGELSLAPAVLSAITRLAPQRMQGTMMGFWFLSVAISSHVGSLLAQFSSLTNQHVTSAAIYMHSFLNTAIIVLIVAMLPVIYFIYYKIRKISLANRLYFVKSE